LSATIFFSRHLCGGDDGDEEMNMRDGLWEKKILMVSATLSLSACVRARKQAKAVDEIYFPDMGRITTTTLGRVGAAQTKVVTKTVDGPRTEAQRHYYRRRRRHRRMTACGATGRCSE
jgi:hypothetical protein